MWLSFYNRKAVGDTLLLTKGDIAVRQEQACESKGTVTRIYNSATNETMGYNLFAISESVDLTANGQVFLTDEQLVKVNDLIKAAGFTDLVAVDHSPKFVVGYVKECVPHEDSDHLSVTQTEVDNGEVLQIVCGAANIKKGQRVVVAKPGAVMPSGLIIWPGALRGVASNGMICSAKELGLENAAAKKGILVLDDSYVVGSAFFK
ncbi:Hypothetical protein Tpal_1466 [Trichococcus palustris]|jgi:tRNA-binding protein|uniref:tRNA-binding domain-containing protein n=1 Tax=Trichococcus palustris TaxID=140314 RepID=A0A143YKX4_9LACT|nr:DUF4479 and tRNA-binding domain-containing protein [Trichococcus palustris]CZQ91798.1 Hypothetical protein Tpal_1466 [Trichococcus palustris]SFL04269.1 tRNA-binding protein [Trichococcus palustris]